MSLLRSEGHPAAGHYPLGYMWNELAFAHRRINANLRSSAVVMHTVVAQVVGGGEHLKDLLEKLSHGE